MAAEDKVTLYGFWASPYVRRVKIALKLKGIPYEYVEEDLMNKSSLFVSLNPVHMKVPVLVHKGKPICESLVILEYIDETWKDGPKLMPEDPYERAQVRFWASFIQEQLMDPMIAVIKTEGEEQKKCITKVNENLQVLEDNLKNLDQSLTCINKTNLGVLDLVFASAFGGDNVQEEVLGSTVMDLEKTPLVSSWIAALLGHPLVKESSIPREKIVGLLKFIRANALKSSTS